MRKQNPDPQYILDFIKAVYPEYTALARCCNTDESILKDATALINELRQQVSDVLKGQEALTQQTIRIRRAVLGDLPDPGGIDTEDMVKAFKQDLQTAREFQSFAERETKRAEKWRDEWVKASTENIALKEELARLREITK